MKRFFLLAAAAALPPAARAQITHYNLADQTISGPSGEIYLDLDLGGFSSTTFAGFDARIFFDSANDFVFVSAEGTWATPSYTTLAPRYTYGATLAFSGLASSAVLQYGSSGFWQNDTGASTAYLALHDTVDSRKSWIGIRYNDAADQIIVESFAVAPSTVCISIIGK